MFKNFFSKINKNTSLILTSQIGVLVSLLLLFCLSIYLVDDVVNLGSYIVIVLCFSTIGYLFYNMMTRDRGDGWYIMFLVMFVPSIMIMGVWFYVFHENKEGIRNLLGFLSFVQAYLIYEDVRNHKIRYNK